MNKRKIAALIVSVMAIACIPLKIHAADPAQISDLKWNTNSTDNNMMDDYLTFTAPTGYDGFGNVKSFYYQMIYYNEDGAFTAGFALNIGNQYPCEFNSSTREVKVPLSGIGNYGRYSDYEYCINLLQVSGTGTTTIATTNHFKKSFFTGTTLDEPKNFVLNGSKIQFDRVFGAKKYIVNHLDSKNAVKESNLVASYNYAYGFATLTNIEAGDVITVVAQRYVDATTTIQSTAAKYVIQNVNKAVEITGIKISDVTLETVAGTAPSYTGKIEVFGTGVDDTVRNAFTLEEDWYEKTDKGWFLVNLSNQSAATQNTFNANYSAVFKPKTQYIYGFMYRYSNPSGTAITIANDAQVSVVGKDGTTYSNLKSCYTHTDTASTLVQFGNVAEHSSADPVAQTETSGAAEKLAVESSGSLTGEQVKVADAIASNNTNIEFADTTALDKLEEQKLAENKVLKDVTKKVVVTDVAINENGSTTLTLDIDFTANYVSFKTGEADPFSFHDEEYNPGKVTIKFLLADNIASTVGDTVEIVHTLKNGSTKTYTGTVTTEDGKKFVSFVDEDGFSKFEVKLTQNTSSNSAADNYVSPDTGDSTNAAAYGIIALSAFCVALAALFSRKKRA